MNHQPQQKQQEEGFISDLKDASLRRRNNLLIHKNNTSNNSNNNNNINHPCTHSASDDHENSSIEHALSFFSLDSICESFNIPMTLIGRYLRSEEAKTIVSCNLQTHRLKLLWMSMLNLMSRLYVTVSTVQENSGNPITSSTLRMYPTPTANVYVSPCIALVKCMAKQLYKQITEITLEIDTVLTRLSEFNKLLSNFSETNHFLISQLFRYCMALESGAAGSVNSGAVTTPQQSSNSMKTTLIKEREFVSHFQRILIKRLGLILNGLDLSKWSQQNPKVTAKREDHTTGIKVPMLKQIDRLSDEDLFDFIASIQDVALKYGVGIIKPTPPPPPPEKIQQRPQSEKMKETTTTTPQTHSLMKNHEPTSVSTDNKQHDLPTMCTTMKSDDQNVTDNNEDDHHCKKSTTNTCRNDHEMDLSGDSSNKAEEEMNNEQQGHSFATSKANLLTEDEKHQNIMPAGEPPRPTSSTIASTGDTASNEQKDHMTTISSSPPLCTPSTPSSVTRPLMTTGVLSATPIPKSSQMIRTTSNSKTNSDDLDLSGTGEDLLPEDALLLLNSRLNSHNTPVLSAKKKNKNVPLSSSTKQQHASTQSSAARNQTMKRKKSSSFTDDNDGDSDEEDVPLVSIIPSKSSAKTHHSNNKSKQPQSRHDLKQFKTFEDIDSLNSPNNEQHQNDELFDDDENNEFDEPLYSSGTP